MKVPNVSRKNAAPLIGQLKPFNASNFHGRIVLKDEAIGSFGNLSSWWIADLMFAKTAAGCYVVWSYETPIAWCSLTNGKWTIPAAWYSQTSCDHTRAVVVGIKESGKWQWDDRMPSDHPHSIWWYVRPQDRTAK